MPISAKLFHAEKKKAYEAGVQDGVERGRAYQTDEFNLSKASAQRDILKAAAELAQANAKLTYAMSRMIAEKGW